MKYIKDNKVLLLKYLSVIISNILIYILVSFYFKSVSNNFLIMCVVAIIVDIIIFNVKEKVKCVYLLDFITSIVVGLLLGLFIKNDLMFSTIMFSLMFGNNIIFMKTRDKDEKIMKRMFNYLMIIVVTIISMFVCLALRMYI